MSMAGNAVSGQLPNTKTTLYTVSYPVTSAILKSVFLCNVAGAARTCNVYINDRRITPPSLPLGIDETALLNGVFMLSQGDVVQGDASVAASVDYTLSLAEKSA